MSGYWKDDPAGATRTWVSKGAEPVETLVERVRETVHALYTYVKPPWCACTDSGKCLQHANEGRADAALTELVERLTAAERERDVALRVIAAYDSPGGLGEVFAAVAVHFVEPAERRAEAAEARVAELEQQLLNAREAPGGPQDKRVAALEERLRSAGNAQDLAHFKYAELQARVAALEEALREITEISSMSYDNRAKVIARAALRVEGDAASPARDSGKYRGGGLVSNKDTSRVKGDEG